MLTTPRRSQVLFPYIARSPYFPATEQAGAVQYAPYNHTYWPVDYGRDPAEEFEAVTQRAALIDVGCERIAELRGPDAMRFANYLCTRDLRRMKPNRAMHTVVCEPTGEILCEAMVLEPAENVIWIAHGPVDFMQWARAIQSHSQFDVKLQQTEVFPLAVQGPHSYEIMKSLAPEASDLRFFRWVETRIAGVDVIVVRSGFTGEFGYEIFPYRAAEAPKVWDAVVDAGTPHDMLITPMTGRNFERGVTDFRYGDGIGLNPFEVRRGGVVDLDGEAFVGREMLLRVAESGPRRKLVGVRFGGKAELPTFEEHWPIDSVSSGATLAGLVIRVRHSYVFNEPIGYAVVESEVPVGSRVTVKHPAGSAEAELVDLPFVP